METVEATSRRLELIHHILPMDLNILSFNLSISFLNLGESSDKFLDAMEKTLQTSSKLFKRSVDSFLFASALLLQSAQKRLENFLL